MSDSRTTGSDTLLLASTSTTIARVLKPYARQLQGKRMAFIPTASDAETYGIANRLARWRFACMGIDVHMVNVAREPYETISGELRLADAIYVCGGNTFHLMHHLNASGASVLIRNKVARGALYIGESAGAVAASPDVGYIAAMDDDRIAGYTQGLALTRYRVIPHMGALMLGNAAARIYAEHQSDSRYVALRNTQALVVSNTQARVIDATSHFAIGVEHTGFFGLT